jgi:hypothetical protein
MVNGTNERKAVRVEMKIETQIKLKPCSLPFSFRFFSDSVFQKNRFLLAMVERCVSFSFSF